MINLDIKRNLSGPDGPLTLNISATVARGELVTLYGPTGCGKSSVLRMVAGLMKPHGGFISVDGETWYDSRQNIFVKTQARNLGMVFQDYTLFPNMTIRQNLEFALPKNGNKNLIDELLDISGLANLQSKMPVLLSGGQKQRAALIRSLIRKPKLLLLDEPLSALDSEMRSRLQDYILQFHKQFNLTTILVSHDLPEIMKLSRRVLVLEQGIIKRDCAPEKLIDSGAIRH
jgi:molybdate transport system ATP-binding protein